MGSLVWDLWLGIVGLGSLALDLGLWSLGLRWLGIIGMRSLSLGSSGSEVWGTRYRAEAPSRADHK